MRIPAIFSSVLRPLLCASAFALAIMAAPAWAQGAQAARGPTPAEVNAVLAATQAQVLEATRKTAEQAIEQNKQALEQSRKVAELAIEQNKLALEQTRKIAEQAIQTAQASNEQIRYVFTLAATFLVLLTGVLGFLGYQKWADLHESFKARLESEVAGVRESALAQARAQQQAVALMCIDIANFTNAFEPVRVAKDVARIKSLAQTLFPQAAIIRASAEQLKDSRTLSWIDCQCALLHYYLGQFRLALEAQKQACVHVVDHTRFDRWRNLACIAAKVYESERDEAALELSIETLAGLREYLTPAQATEILKDDDLVKVFERAPNSRAALAAIERGTGFTQAGTQTRVQPQTPASEDESG